MDFSYNTFLSASMCACVCIYVLIVTPFLISCNIKKFYILLILSFTKKMCVCMYTMLAILILRLG